MKHYIHKPCSYHHTSTKGLPVSEAEAWKQDYISIFSSTAKDLDFTNAYCIQKIVADKYKALFGREFVSSKAIKTQTNQNV